MSTMLIESSYHIYEQRGNKGSQVNYINHCKASCISQGVSLKLMLALSKA